MKTKDMIGKRFGRLLVVGVFVNVRPGVFKLRCICDCGKESFPSSANLGRGKSRSCGCQVRVQTIKRSTKHGMCGSKEYRVWKSMIARCEQSSNKSFEWYGGRGIKVCSSWRNNPERFISDMGPKPDGFEIDRINNDGDYCPSNCRWATKKENCRNKGNNNIVEINGEAHCVIEWSEIAGINPTTLYGRKAAGYSSEDFLGEVRGA